MTIYWFKLIFRVCEVKKNIEEIREHVVDDTVKAVDVTSKP
jgi:hypothetical protein